MGAAANIGINKVRSASFLGLWYLGRAGLALHTRLPAVLRRRGRAAWGSVWQRAAGPVRCGLTAVAASSLSAVRQCAEQWG